MMTKQKYVHDKARQIALQRTIGGKHEIGLSNFL